MRTRELAEMTGVTVRTLRHYHQIGLLPEPPRSSAGYRDYNVGHLVRMLRITRMTALGIPLSALQAVLDDPTVAEDLLKELDRQADTEIKRLSARRATIAALRRSGSPVDLPPEFSELRPHSPSTPVEMVRHEHEQLLLLGHLLGRDGPARIAQVLGAVQRDLAGLETLMTRFYALESNTAEAEVISLVDEMATQLAPVSGRLTALEPQDPQISALMDELSEQTFNPVQHRVLRDVDQRLEDGPTI